MIIRAEARRILKKARQTQNRELVLQEASKQGEKAVQIEEKNLDCETS
jgi:hypothetical protein